MALSYRYLFSFFVLMFLFLNSSVAQSVDRSVYSSAGRFVSNSSVSIAYNIGESVVFTAISNEVLTQGFEQGNDITLSSLSNTTSSIFSNVFPNPVSNQLFLSCNAGMLISDFEIEVYDVVGRNINVAVDKPSSFVDYVFSLDLSSFPVGVYFVKVSSSKNNYNHVFKINKA